jgi:signal-transduction protein with cAMP-binding, CBS, and nucleotidyltransferase domain
MQIEPEELNSTQRQMLKESFSVIEQLCKVIQHRYGPGTG